MADFLNETVDILNRVDRDEVAAVSEQLRLLRERNGRLFIIGNGGGAGHASHAAADFRKIGRIESYAWGDNVSDITAYINDNSWRSAVADWLKDSRCRTTDALLVFSVGGASNDVSANIAWALACYPHCVLGIVGEEGGVVARYGTAVIRIPTSSTPQVEGIQAVLWHMLVTSL